MVNVVIYAMLLDMRCCKAIQSYVTIMSSGPAAIIWANLSGVYWLHDGGCKPPGALQHTAYP
jgi:hypothetical protein